MLSKYVKKYWTICLFFYPILVNIFDAFFVSIGGINSEYNFALSFRIVVGKSLGIFLLGSLPAAIVTLIWRHTRMREEEQTIYVIWSLGIILASLSSLAGI